MSKSIVVPNVRTHIVFIAAAVLLMAQEAHALPVLSGNVSVVQDGGAPVVAADTKAGASFMDAYASRGSSLAHTSGTAADGSFRWGSAAYGNANSNALLNYHNVIVNPFSYAVSAVFTFTLNAGSVDVANEGAFSAGEGGTALVDLKVSRDGSLLGRTTRQVSLDTNVGATQQGSSDGLDIVGSYTVGADSVSFYWDTQALSINLGVLAANAALTLDYDAVSSSLSSFLSETVSYPCGGDGNDGGDCSYTLSGGYADSWGGDPFSASFPSEFFSVTFTPAASNDLPEPATVGLFGVGLMGLGWLRRRHDRIC